MKLENVITLSVFSKIMKIITESAFPDYEIEIVSLDDMVDMDDIEDMEDTGEDIDPEEAKGMVIHPKNTKTGISPTIYLNPLYWDFLNEKPFINIIEALLSTIHTAFEQIKQHNLNELIGEAIKFNQTKDRVSYRLVSNQNLESIPHREFLNLNIVYFVPLCLEKGKRSAIIIDNTLMQIYDTDENTLFQLATANTPELNKDNTTALIRTFKEMMQDTYISEDGSISGEIPDEPKEAGFDLVSFKGSTYKIHDVTFDKSLFGTSILLDKNFLKQIGEIIGSFYIAMPSDNEIVFIQGLRDDWQEFWKEWTNVVNTMINKAKDNDTLLSEDYYYYDTNTNKLTIA